MRVIDRKQFKHSVISRARGSWVRRAYHIPLVAQYFELRKVSRGGQMSLTIASREFAKGEYKSLILQLTRSRVARDASTWALANGYMWRALTRKGALPISPSWEVGVGEEESRVSDSWIMKWKALLMMSPQYHRKCFRPSDQKKGTWCAIKFYHPFVHHDLKEKGFTSS